MEHNRPEGLSQGYFCLKCGEPVGMLGHDECEPNPELVRTVGDLNRKEPKMAEKYCVDCKYHVKDSYHGCVREAKFNLVTGEKDHPELCSDVRSSPATGQFQYRDLDDYGPDTCGEEGYFFEPKDA